MQVQIKHRYSNAVLFECDAPEGLESGMAMRHALEKAQATKANLSYANLSYANLRYADLSSANLSYANLRSADLRSANLSYANLRSANLRSANLRSADLRSADLSSANLSYANLRSADLRSANLREGQKLAGDRPFISMGPIGSRADYLSAYITDAGVMIRAGCFFDTRSQFELALNTEHGENNHAQEYRAALVLIDKHAELWLPAVEATVVDAEVVTA